MRSMIVSVAAISLILMFGTVGVYAGDMALYLPFDEGAGEIAMDASPNGNDGILHGVGWTDGKYGSAVEFSGEAETWVEVPDSPSLDITDGISILCWLYPTQFTDEWFRIIVKTDANDEAPWMVYGIYEEGATDGKTGFIFATSGGVQNGASADPIPLNEWTHIAATYDGSMARMYYNGNVVAEAAAEASGPMDTNDVPISIGRNNIGMREHYIGLMDEIAIFSRALSQAEIQGAMDQVLATVEPSEKLPMTWGFVKSQY